MQSDAWKISATTVGWTAGGNFGDIIRVLGSFCSFVIFSSKALIALVSSYLPDEEHSFRTMLTWSHTGSFMSFIKRKVKCFDRKWILCRQLWWWPGGGFFFFLSTSLSYVGSRSNHKCKINDGELWLLVNVKISLMLLFSHLCGPAFIS